MFARLFSFGALKAKRDSSKRNRKQNKSQNNHGQQQHQQQQGSQGDNISQIGATIPIGSNLLEAPGGINSSETRVAVNKPEVDDFEAKELALATATAAVTVETIRGRLTVSDNPLLPEELCEIPTFKGTPNCDKALIEETRRRLNKKYLKRPESFAPADVERMLSDDWTVSRFLLRCRLSPKRAARLMEQCGKFRQEFKMGVTKLSDFPIEFHKVGALFRYAPDRVGNQTLYMRAKMHRRIPELSIYMKAFILCWLEECDLANDGRGTAVIMDLTNSGIQNLDPAFLFWLVLSFRNYCPKGLSYIIVYNLPWIMNATAGLALSWLSSNNRRRLRFVSGDGIRAFIAQENLPDYMGGTCKLDYRKVPEGSRYAEEAAVDIGMTREQSRKLREAYVKFLKEMDKEIQLESETSERQLKNGTTANSERPLN